MVAFPRAVLATLKAARLTANTEKCEFGKTSIEFLDHTVSAAGIAPLPSWVVAIAAHPCPTNIKELQNFLGVINFYRKFVPGAEAMPSGAPPGPIRQKRRPGRP